jgi:hypothetical protein
MTWPMGGDFGLPVRPPAEEPGVYADRGQLRILLQNLLSNAMNHRSTHRTFRFVSRGPLTTTAQLFASPTPARASHPKTGRKPSNHWCGSTATATATAPARGWAWPPAAPSPKPMAGTSRSQKLREAGPPSRSASLPPNQQLSTDSELTCHPRHFRTPITDLPSASR